MAKNHVKISSIIWSTTLVQIFSFTPQPENWPETFKKRFNGKIWPNGLSNICVFPSVLKFGPRSWSNILWTVWRKKYQSKKVLNGKVFQISSLTKKHSVFFFPPYKSTYYARIVFSIHCKKMGKFISEYKTHLRFRNGLKQRDNRDKLFKLSLASK